MSFDPEEQYEFEERIAMRMEAGCDLATADHLARVDLSHRPEEQGVLAALRAGSEIERLFAERQRVAELWKNEDDPQRVVMLRERWAELCINIAKIKCKESENGNDRRVSG
jgi:hypothetical protein